MTQGVDVQRPSRWIARTTRWLSATFIALSMLLAGCASLPGAQNCQGVSFFVMKIEGRAYYVFDEPNMAKLVENLNRLKAGECGGKAPVQMILKPSGVYEYGKGGTRT